MHVHMMTYLRFQQLWTVALWLTQPMAELVTVVGQHLDRQPPTDVTQATTCWEAVLALVKLQEGGLGVHLPVSVCSLFIILNKVYVHNVSLLQQLWIVVYWLTQPMAKLVTLVEQHLDRQPPTVAVQTTTWWEAALAHVKLQACGLGVHLLVTVRCFTRNLKQCKQGIRL